MAIRTLTTRLYYNVLYLYIYIHTNLSYYHDDTPSQDNNVFLAELRDVILEVREKVNRHEDELAKGRGQGGKEKEKALEVTPSDHQSRGGSHSRSDAGGSSSSHSQYHPLPITEVWEKFRKFTSLMFERKLDPIAALEWLKRVEKIFRVIEISSQQKVVVAEQLLQKAAEEWWESGHWFRTCRTPRHLVDLYQESLKNGGKMPKSKANHVDMVENSEQKDIDINYLEADDFLA
ncbi:hypothetical protein QN277_018793 [Acacia crassicarpa]|uniref:Uncharacterized protein n=1 Tax=Acacia crassicarpa TaxID=499986 RepID=A0AAE1JUC5_9FABA|nr:hypothetical protein QN277_018793 [Acacia crassicarpa]